MLDPLTSLTIACAVAQFLDFGGKLLERAYKISRTPENALPELREIEELVARLREHAQRLERSRATGRDPAQHADVTEDEAMGVALAVECEALAQRIQSTFADIKITGQPTMLEGLKLAYAIAKKKKDFVHHKQACEKLKERLMEHMMGAIYSQTSRLAITLDEMSRRDSVMEIRLTEKLSYLKSGLYRALPSQDASLRSIKQSAAKVDNKQLADTLTDLLAEMRSVAASQQLLTSLRYEYMEARRSAVAQRHAQTFEWNFCRT